MTEPTPSGRFAASRSSWLLAAVGPLLLGVILASVDRAALLEALSGADPGLLVLAYLAPLPAIALRTWRWQLLLADHARTWRFADLLDLYARAIAVGVVTPGRVGEVTKALPIARRGAGFGPALATVVVDRLADLGFIAVLAALAVPVLFGAGPRLGAVGTLAAASVGGGAIAFLLARGGVPSRWLPATAAVPQLPVGAALGCAVLTVASWAITYLASWLYAKSLGLPIGYVGMAVLSALCSIVASLPISIAGAGTRDATLLLALGPLGATRPEAIALSTLMLSNALFVGVVCALAFFRASAERGEPDEVGG